MAAIYTKLSIDAFFDLKRTAHAEIFEDTEFPWEVIPLIAEYIEYCLAEQHYEVRADTSPAVFVGEQVSIGVGTIIEPGVVIHGPAIIGEHCILRSGAYIRAHVIIGDRCLVGNSTEVKNSLLFNNVTIPHYNYVGDSILGYNVHLGAGAILSNIKTPPKEIIIHTLEKSYQTGLLKLGAIVGEQTEIGSNTVCNPGTMIGRNCTIYPTALIRGVIPPNTIVKVRQQQEIIIKRPATEEG